MVDYSTLSIVLTGLGIIGAILYYTLTLRNATKTRQAQLFMSIYNRFHEVEFWKHLRELQEWEWDSPEEYYEKYDSNPEMASKWNSVGSFFEGMGVMVKRNLIDVTVVDDLMSAPLMSLWQKWQPTILEQRRLRNMPTVWEWYEYLYEEVRKVAAREHGAEHVKDMVRLFKTPLKGTE